MCSSDRLLQSTLFTWCPSLAPVAADMAAATEDQSISIVDRSGNPLITDDSRAVAVHGLGASTRVVVVLETGDVLLRDMLAGHGGGAYNVSSAIHRKDDRGSMEVLADTRLMLASVFACAGALGARQGREGHGFDGRPRR